MYQNYPNPFNPITSIKYDLPTDAHTVMEVFDIMGKHVKTLVDENQTAGFKTIKWDATNSTGNNVLDTLIAQKNYINYTPHFI